MRTRSFLRRPAGRLLAGALSTWMVFCPVVPAFAGTLNWAPLSRGFMAPKMVQDLNALKGNIEYVDNNLGAALLNIPPAEAGRVAFGVNDHVNPRLFDTKTQMTNTMIGVTMTQERETSKTFLLSSRSSRALLKDGPRAVSARQRAARA